MRESIYSLHGLLTETVVKTGKTLCVEDAIAYPEYGQAPEGYNSYLGVPLRISTGEVIGTICSFCIQPRQFILEEVHTVEIFAQRAATAIDNYTLYQQQLRFNKILEEVAKRTAELKAAFCPTEPEGTGLGLAIVKRIVEAHNGQLSIQSDAENGTIVNILLPLISPHIPTNS